jgi:hypothetical protein
MRLGSGVRTDACFSILGRLGVPHGPYLLLALALLATLVLLAAWRARLRSGEAADVLIVVGVGLLALAARRRRAASNPAVVQRRA